MCEPTLRVWFVCKLCREFFEQVGAFIEPKKEDHFIQFQNTRCIVFEETEVTEHGLLCPVVTNNVDHQLADEGNERQIKIEVNGDDPIIQSSSDIIQEPNWTLVEPKSEQVIFEGELNPDNEISYFDLKPEKNPYVLLKRLTSDEIQKACLLKCEQENSGNSSEPLNSSGDSSNIIDSSEFDKSTENQPTPTATVKHYLQFECKLCSKQLRSATQLKIHVGICAQDHEDRNRFCVICSRKFCDTHSLKDHRLRFHGTEEENLSVYKFKCYLCPKKFREAIYLGFHLESHKYEKQKKVINLKSNLLTCSHSNCGKEFRCNSHLQRHIDAVHLDVRPFSCTFPNCNKTFKERSHLNTHLRIHTGERRYKCTVDNCNKAFVTSYKRSMHHLRVHSPL